MAETPRPKSYEQLLGEVLATFVSKTGVNDLNIGSLMTSFFEANTQMVFRSTGDVFQVLRANSVDRASGDTLRRIALEEGVTPRPPVAASDFVTITDTSFEKISTNIYAGQKSPPPQSTAIFVSEASEFPATGEIYIGRGTSNVEGPIEYSAITPIGGYFELQLSSPTQKYHNIGESVVLAQGGVRSIPANTIVRVPASGGNQSIAYRTREDAIILDGEDTLTSVRVVATEPGKRANISRGAIREFAAPPFAGAAVTNPRSFSNGRDIETDEELRDRVKAAFLTRGLGTALAVENSVKGAQAPDDASIVLSSQIDNIGDRTVLYVDDGTGYERQTRGVGLEFIIDSALGGETVFQLATSGRQTQVTKAFLESGNSEPFAVRGGQRLALLVGDRLSEHIFDADDFQAEGSATALEIVSSINANPGLLFSASTSNSRQQIVLFARAELEEFLSVTQPTAGTDAAPAFSFPEEEIETLRLYKNGRALSRNGRNASILTEPQQTWSPSMATPQTLTISVDGTAFITYTFDDADFQQQGTFSSLSPENSLQSWADVINTKVTGITASVDGQQLRISSNLGTSERALLEIDPSSSLVATGMFSIAQGLSAQGRQSDFSLLRPTAQVELREPLTPGDRLTAGIEDARASVRGEQVLGGTINIQNDAYLWVLVDDPSAEIVPVILGTGIGITVSQPALRRLRLSSTTNSFANSQVGDYLIVWSEYLNPANRKEGRIVERDGDYVEIEITTAEDAAAVPQGPVVLQRGITIVRCSRVPQRAKIEAGVYDITSVASIVSDQLLGAESRVEDSEFIILTSTSLNERTGSVLIVDADENALPLGFVRGMTSQSIVGSFAFRESGFYDGQIPLFVHEPVNVDTSGNPPDSFVSAISSNENLELQGLDPSMMLVQLDGFGRNDAQGRGHPVVVSDIDNTQIELRDQPYIKRFNGAIDRFYLARPLNIGGNDRMIITLDNDVSERNFEVSLQRRVETSPSAPLSSFTFSVFDVELGPTASLVDSFGEDFDFNDYKALMRAKRVLDGNNDEDAILFRCARFGKTGEYYRVGYTYPSEPDQEEISHTITVTYEVEILISLKSGSEAVTSIDATTEWNVTVLPDTPAVGVDQVTYTYAGTGTAPLLGSLVGNEYVNIGANTGFSEENTGVFKLSASSATSFTVSRPGGVAVPENDVPTLVGSSIEFYEPDPTTAEEVVEYVEENLSDFLTAELVDDNGTSGAGEIELSTFQQTGFVDTSLRLLDGENWILNSDLLAATQFAFKRELDYPSDIGYAFNEGEEIRLAPTTNKQLSEFLQSLAVTGLTTVANVDASDAETRLQIRTEVRGSDGAVQVLGGTGSVISSPTLGSSQSIEGFYMLTSVPRAQAAAIAGGQLLKLTAQNRQNKATGISATTTGRITPNEPQALFSTIELGNRQPGERHFGIPRFHVASAGLDWRLEKQGMFSVLAYAGTALVSPLSRMANLFDTGGGRVAITRLPNSTIVEYRVTDGDTNFAELSIGDIVLVQGTTNPANEDAFRIVSISADNKAIRVINSNGVSNQLTETITITNNANLSGDSFVIGSSTLTEGNQWSVGATEADTADSLATAIASISGFDADAIGTDVIITTTSSTAIPTIQYNDQGTPGATLLFGSFQGETFSAGDFSCLLEVQEGDTLILKEPFSILNQGRFRVVRIYKNSVYFENPNLQPEDISLPSTLVNLGGDATTEYDVDSINGVTRLSWTRTGTEPNLFAARPGQSIDLGPGVVPANEGTFIITGVQDKRFETTRFTLPAASAISSGQYVLVRTAGDDDLFALWFNVGGAGGAPSVPSATNVEVAISPSDDSTLVANQLEAAAGSIAGLSATRTGSVVIVTTDEADETTASSQETAINVTVQTVVPGRRQAIFFKHPEGVTETGISLLNIQVTEQPIVFYPYDSTVENDLIAVEGSALGATNEGTWRVEEVLSESEAVIDGALATVEPTILSGTLASIRVEEGQPYTGYKEVRTVAVDPGDLGRSTLVFETDNQFSKVNDAAQITISGVEKLNFSTRNRRGLDSYRHDIGMLAEVNRIVYGDPRDPASYSGVAAAGAEILTDPPLVRRVSLGIAVRVRTGVPFARISEQIRNSVSALIGSSPIGESIAVSRIIATVDAIPGVKAIAITSPLYDAANDLIVIQPGEKPFIIEELTDIIISQIGT